MSDHPGTSARPRCHPRPIGRATVRLEDVRPVCGHPGGVLPPVLASVRGEIHERGLQTSTVLQPTFGSAGESARAPAELARYVRARGDDEATGNASALTLCVTQLSKFKLVHALRRWRTQAASSTAAQWRCLSSRTRRLRLSKVPRQPSSWRRRDSSDGSPVWTRTTVVRSPRCVKSTVTRLSCSSPS